MFPFDIRVDQHQYRVKGVSDQVIPPTSCGVLNPEIFEFMSQHYRFYAGNLDLDLLTNTNPPEYVRSHIEHSEVILDEHLIQQAARSLDSIDGDIFSVPIQRFPWREKAPSLLSSLAAHGNLRPLCALAERTETGAYLCSVHPGKKRLSLLRFLGKKSAPTLVQVLKSDDFIPPHAVALRSLADLVDFWKTENIFFRTSPECMNLTSYRLEVQCYDESHRKVVDNLTAWEDSVDFNFMKRRYQSLARGLTVHVAGADYEGICGAIDRAYSFHDRQFFYEDICLSLPLRFKKWDGKPVREPGIAVGVHGPLNFCMSHLLLFLYTTQNELVLTSGQKSVHIFLNDDDIPTGAQDMLGRGFGNSIQLEPGTFEKWSIRSV